MAEEPYDALKRQETENLVKYSLTKNKKYLNLFFCFRALRKNMINDK
ncbi:hypothetical protein KBB17_03820 [Candidatus Saccharibacteria bacterium]|jgi:hypothetical protein|nr:hypothetical protein [Candidatus Saccharibacteria bacterium]MBP7018604.1 hypothetical protein [Candidatus Saccharibacteria bacterium]MBP9132074.1 hypothetical protein [Candidatus Saccharibacteria bacterium]